MFSFSSRNRLLCSAVGVLWEKEEGGGGGGGVNGNGNFIQYI